MAKEKTIRKHCKNNLLEQDYTVCVPNRSRYGAFSNYLPKHKQGDDLFGIFDLVAWKDDEMLFVQYTAKSAISTREKKVKEFLDNADVSLPKGCKAEVWGYVDRSGGEFVKRGI